MTPGRPNPQAAVGAWRLQLIGPPTLVPADGSPQALDRKGAAALLLAALDLGLDRSRVAGLLWPEVPESTARTNLRVLLHRQKMSFGRTLAATGPRWALAPDIQTDLAPPGPQVLDAPMLQGHAYDDLEDLQRFVLQARQRLMAQASGILLSQAEQALRRGGPDDQPFAVQAARRILRQDPTDEAAARLLMQAHRMGGDRRAALEAYESLRHSLAESLGTPPDRPTRLLYLDLMRDVPWDPRSWPAGDPQAGGDAGPPVGSGAITPSSGMSPAPLATTDPSPGPDAVDRRSNADRLRSPVAIGRAQVLDHLAGQVRQRRHIWLEGDAGVGKSRVVEELLLRQPAVRLRCRPYDATRPYGLVRRLIGQIGQERPGEVHASISELLKPGQAQASIDLQDVFEAVMDTLRRLARDGLPLLVIEDLHHIDPSSGQLLQELLDAGGDHPGAWAGLPTLLFSARRRHESPPFQALRQLALDGAHFEQVTLTPLDLDAVRNLVQGLAAHADLAWLQAPGIAERLHRLAGGNAFFTLEVIRAATATPDPAALRVRVDSVEDLLRQQVQKASPEAAELAALVAVAQSDFDPRMPSALLGQDSRTLSRAWQALVHLGLFRDHGLAHDLALAAVQSSLFDPQVQLLHDGVADFLEQHGGADERVAFHGLRSQRPARALMPTLAALRSLHVEGLSVPALDLARDAVQRMPALVDSEEGFEICWWDLRLRGLARTATVAALEAEAAALMAAHRTPRQRLRALWVRLNLRQNQPLDAEDRRGAELAWHGPRDGALWATVMCSYLTALSDEGADRELLAERARETVAYLSSLGPDLVPVEAGSAAIAMGNMRGVVPPMADAIELLQAWLPRVEAAHAAQAVSQIRRALAHLLLSSGRALEAMRQQQALMPRFDRRGWSPQQWAEVTRWAAYAAVKCGELSLALDLQRQLRSRGLEDRRVGSVSQTLQLRLRHALGDIRPTPAGLLPEDATEANSLHIRRLLATLHGYQARVHARLNGAPASFPDDLLCRPGDPPEPPSRQGLRASLQGDQAVLDRVPALIDQHLHDTAAQHAQDALLTLRTDLALAAARLGQAAVAWQQIDQVLQGLDDGVQPDDLCAADHAARLWEAMRDSGHAKAETFRGRWAAWRQRQAESLDEAWRPAFLWRHGWVADPPAAPGPALDLTDCFGI